jgi:hypothetical protein
MDSVSRTCIQNSAHVNGLQVFYCKNPGTNHEDAAMLVSTIVGAFQTFSLLPHNMLGEVSKWFQSKH